MRRILWLLPIICMFVLAACGSSEAPAVGEEIPPEQEAVEQAAPTEVEPAKEEVADEMLAEESGSMAILSDDVEVMSGGQAYQSYLAVPAEGGPHPAVVLIHSFNGLEQGYRDMTDQFAAEGFVVLAVGWQTFERSPFDATIEQLILDSVDFLTSRDDVDSDRLGLTGFCAGGRYTMLFLPQVDAFKAGVAWYGFPYRGETEPASLIDSLTAPLLIIHGTADSASPIADINRYASELEDAGKDFELQVYSGEPHGFMLQEGQLRDDEVARDAFGQMVSYFKRNLG